MCYGELDEKKKLLPNSNQLIDYLFVNAISKIILINSFNDYFKNQKSGNISVVTSVAGDIGKSSNYIYGSSNAMLSNYLTGLRQEFFYYGVRVVNIKPGLLDTPMTAKLKKNILFSDPNLICNKLVSSIEKDNKDIYLPFFWKYIMLIIKMIPKVIYNRLKI